MSGFTGQVVTGSQVGTRLQCLAGITLFMNGGSIICMASGLFVKGYVAYLRRTLYGFSVSERGAKRKPRVRPRRPKKILVSSKPTYRVRVKTTPNPKTVVKAGEWWKLVSGTWIKHLTQNVTLTNPYATIKHTQDYKNPGPPYVTGGPFTSVEVTLMPVPVNGIGNYASVTTLNMGDGAFFRQYRGGFASPTFSGVDFTDAQYASREFIIGSLSGFVPSMSPYHALVDKRLRPKLNHADLGQSLAEIGEIPRMLRSSAKDFRDYWRFLGGSDSSKRMSPKGAADTFVGSQFGWAPFIRDILDVCDLVVNADKYVDDLTSKNDRWDHRKSVLTEFETDEVISKGEGQKVQPVSIFFDDLMQPGASWTKRFQYSKRETTRVWATGDFKFYRPEFDMTKSDYNSGLNQMRRLQTLAGLNMSPSLLWKITPWSWLVDWFTNVGSVIDAISAAGLDGVVSKNVYLMMSYERRLVLNQEFNFASRPCSMEFVRNVTSKQRGHASTPFNFGLLPTQLSGKQWSILGALGISKFL